MTLSHRSIAVRLLCCFALVSLVGSLASGTAAAPASARYDAGADFAAAKNPNGTWRYLAGGTLLTFVNKNCGPLGINCRWNGKPQCNSAIVGKSKTGKAVSYYTVRLPADHLVLDPEAIANVAVRWTAPAAGSFRIRGDFLGVDTTGQGHVVAVVGAKRKIYAGTISSFGQRAAFNLTRTVARGETIDFVVSTGSACTYLSTGLKVTISAGS